MQSVQNVVAQSVKFTPFSAMAAEKGRCANPHHFITIPY